MSVHELFPRTPKPVEAITPPAPRDMRNVGQPTVQILRRAPRAATTALWLRTPRTSLTVSVGGVRSTDAALAQAIVDIAAEGGDVDEMIARAIKVARSHASPPRPAPSDCGQDD